MKTNFLANFIFLVFVNVLIKPIYVFGIDMRVQNIVGEVEYGRYFSIYNFAFLFYIVLDLGLTQYNSRIIAQQPERLGEYLPNFAMAKGILGVLFFMLLYTGACTLGYTKSELFWLFPIACIHLLNSIVGYLRSNVAALHLFRLDAVLSTVNRMLLIVVCGIMLYGSFSEQFRLEYFIYAQVATLSLTALLCLAAIVPYAKGLRLRADKKLIFRIIKEGYPYALLVLLTTIYTRVDAVMLTELMPGVTGEREAGYYAAAFRFWDMSMIVGLLMASQLLPMFARHIQTEDKEEIRKLAVTGFRVVMLMSVALSVGVACYSSEIMYASFSEYPNAYVAGILAFLILSIIPSCSSYVFNTLLNANASLKALNVIGLVGVLLNIILNLFLIPRYGALGAVYATLFTQSLAAFGHIIFANAHLSLNLPKTMFLRVLAFGGLMYIVFSILMPMLPIHWIIQLVLGGMLSLPLGWIIGLLDIVMLRELLRK